MKFTESGGIRVRVDVRHDERHMLNLTIDVRDTGIGIAEHKLDRLFQAFSQLDSSSARRFGGTGLGLVIARRLAQILGGDLTVTSDPEQGSCFSLALRVRSRALEQPAVAEPKKEVTQLSGRVLLVEDNDVNRLVACRMLEHLGLEVATAGDGATALAMCAAVVPLVIPRMAPRAYISQCGAARPVKAGTRSGSAWAGGRAPAAATPKQKPRSERCQSLSAATRSASATMIPLPPRETAPALRLEITSGRSRPARSPCSPALA